MRARVLPSVGVFVVVLAAAASLHASCADAAVREYFIRVDVKEKWNYAPSGKDLLTGLSLDSMRMMNASTGLLGREHMHQPATWAKASTKPPRVGRVYTKAVMVEFTDASFTQPKSRPNEEAHLGLLGPTLRAAVGDTIRVTFKNNVPDTGYLGLTGIQFSLHPHGVFYNRTNEGAPYISNNTIVTVPGSAQRRSYAATDLSEDEHHARLVRSTEANHLNRRAGIHASTGGGSTVRYGETYTYEWFVPERAGPGPNDKSSVAWFYHSHVDEPADVAASLVGAMIISRASAWNEATQRPKDVQREIVVLFNNIDETSSPFALHNAFVLANFSAPAYMEMTMNMMFIDSQIKRTVNGYFFGNLPGLYMFENERTRWYVGTLGSEKDVHGAHWHANTLLHNGNRVDSIPLVPGVLTSADMIPDNLGQWQFHCHTSHHIHAGMTALYEVLSCPSCTVVPEISEVSKNCPSVAECTSMCGATNVERCGCDAGSPDVVCKKDAPSAGTMSSAALQCFSLPVTLSFLTLAIFLSLQ